MRPAPLAVRRRRGLFLSVLACGLGLVPASPARAIEELTLRLPVLDLSLSARVSELQSPQALWAGDSDLAQLNRAFRGRYAAQVGELLQTPLPLQQDADNPMTRQATLLLRSLVDVDAAEPDLLAADPVQIALGRVQAARQPLTLLNLLQALPGRHVTIRLERALPYLRRLQRQEGEADAMIAGRPPLPPAPASLLGAGPLALVTEERQLPDPQGQEPLPVTVVRPDGVARLPTVVISHGLWDAPESFLGWARHLASHGATVLLPRHRGSDISQQAEMLAGEAPPPPPDEFLRRPREVSLVLDALGAGQLGLPATTPTRDVVFMGHSWGGTTALQLAGARSIANPLWQACNRTDAPQRNISWVLQCSFLPAAIPDSLADPRIARVVAVSPPQGLVFAAGLDQLNVPVLLVSGTRDLVVPPHPEALKPFPAYGGQGHRLVLVQGGTHFNLPATAATAGGPLRALLLRWLQGQPVEPGVPLGDPAGLPLHVVPVTGNGSQSS
jgi:predicted dienelactone hydrolase